MNLLHAVPSSVLWLLESNRQASGQPAPRSRATRNILTLPSRVAITFTPDVPPICTWLTRYYEGTIHPSRFQRLRIATRMLLKSATICAVLIALAARSRHSSTIMRRCNHHRQFIDPATEVHFLTRSHHVPSSRTGPAIVHRRKRYRECLGARPPELGSRSRCRSQTSRQPRLDRTGRAIFSGHAFVLYGPGQYRQNVEQSQDKAPEQEQGRSMTECPAKAELDIVSGLMAPKVISALRAARGRLQNPRPLPCFPSALNKGERPFCRKEMRHDARS